MSSENKEKSMKKRIKLNAKIKKKILDHTTQLMPKLKQNQSLALVRYPVLCKGFFHVFIRCPSHSPVCVMQ